MGQKSNQVLVSQSFPAVWAFISLLFPQSIETSVLHDDKEVCKFSQKFTRFGTTAATTSLQQRTMANCVQRVLQLLKLPDQPEDC